MEQLPEPTDSTDESESSSIAVIAASIGAYFGKMPAALQRNVTKAVSHLFKVPNAFLDGLADELKATSAARIKITEATGTKLAESIAIDSALAQLAVHTHANKILRQQKNTVNIIKIAAEEINNSNPGPISTEPNEISEDWLNAFESEAVNMSSEQMQTLFGKMLAGEIRQPSTFSIRTVKIMGQMDTDVAELFQRFCSMVCSHKLGQHKMVLAGGVYSLTAKHAAALHDFGIPFTAIKTLEEYGLISDPSPALFPHFFSVFNTSDNSVQVPLTYSDRNHILKSKEGKLPLDYEATPVSAIELSRVGRELLNVVDIQENMAYTQALVKHLDDLGLELLEVPPTAVVGMKIG